MIFSKTILNVCDNSGLKYVKCLKVVKTISAYGKKQVAKAGDVILVSAKILTGVTNLKKGQVFKALIVRTNSKVKRLYGFLSFEQNSVLILNKKLEPLGNRISGPVFMEALEQNYIKISSIRMIGF
jgi:large subunit ribosomal protein L14